MAKILFLGLGHLAEFFAEEVSKDWKCSGTYRSKLNKDKFSDFNTYHFDSSALDDFPFEKTYDYVIWSFPPFDEYKKLLRVSQEFFADNVIWIYIGSTGIYSSGEITEKTKPGRESTRQERLFQIEDTLNQLERDIIIVRPSGLVDQERNPKKWLANKLEIQNSQSRVNWVYTRDVARFLIFIIESGASEGSFNLSASEHPIKANLYSEILGEEVWKDKVPDGRNESEKIILNGKSKSLGFKYLLDENISLFFK